MQTTELKIWKGENEMKFTKESLYRAMRTFIQAMLGYVAVNVVLVDFSSSREVLKTALMGLLVSAVSAGLSAVMNLEKGNKENANNG